MASAGTIEVDIRANAAQFLRSMNQIQRNTKSTSDQLRAFGRIAAQTIATVFTGATVRNITRSADELQNFARRIGVGARELQAWQLIAERFNVANQSLNTGIQRLTRRSAEAAQGFGEAKDAIAELGIDAEAFTQLSLDDQILTLADAFDQVTTDADRVRLAFKLFDTEGVAFLQFLREGRQGLRDLRSELEGQLWSDAEIARLGELNTQLTELGQTLTLQFGPVLVFLANLITDGINVASDALTDLVLRIQALLGNEIAALKLIGDPSVGGAQTGTSPDGTAVNIQQNQLDQAQQLAQAIVTLTAATAAERVRLEQEAAAESAAAWEAFATQYETLFTQNMVQAADGAFDSILQSWIRTLQQMVAQAIASRIFDFLGGTGIGQSIASAFGGARADGGPVSSGRAYLVGERGPEMFVPNSSGNIIPNGAGGAVINQQINVSGGANRAELVAAMNVAKEQAKREINDQFRRRGR